MTLYDTLTELAEEHLRQMTTVPWAAYAEAIREGKAGETFGCEVDGRYFDVGDQAAWLAEPEGDIRLVAHATTYGDDGETAGSRVEREAVIRRGSPAIVRFRP